MDTANALESVTAEGTLLTALTRDGGARLLFAHTTKIVEYARLRHDCSRTVTAALGRCLTAAAIMGGTLKDEDGSVTLRINGGGPAGSFTCVSDAHGNVRGCCEDPKVELPPNAQGKLDVGGAVGREGDLYVVRDYGFGEPYVGYTKLVSGEIAEDITAYYAMSEQTPTVCALGVRVWPEGKVKGAGGFLLQLLPGAPEELADRLQERVEALPSLSALIGEGKTGEEITALVFGEIPYDLLETKPIRYRCNCSRERYRSAIKGIGIRELRDMRDSGEEAEVICRFCGERYVFPTEELAAMCAEREAELRAKRDQAPAPEETP